MEDKQLWVSIIVPVYNVEAYLRRCVDSLCGQTLREIEIILIDDGSKDASGAICDQLALEDTRIKVLHKENAGQGLARNDGLDLAKGKYILFVDSDDYIEAYTCERLVDVMEKKQADLCCFGYRIETPEGELFYQAKLKEKIYEGEQLKKQFVLHFFGDDQEEDELRGVSACMTMFRREVIETYGVRFHSERKCFSEDTIFNLDFCLHAQRAMVLPEYFYHYWQNGNSFSHAYRKDRFPLTQALCQLLSEYAKRYGIEKETKNRIRMVVWVSLLECMKQEVRRIKETSFRQVHTCIRQYRKEALVVDMLAGLDAKKFPMKQRVLFVLLRLKMITAVMGMVWLRNKKGL